MKEKKRKRKKIILGVLVGYIAIILIGYLGVSFYFASHFFEGTKINGIECSNLTVDQVKNEIIGKINEYELKIELRGGGVEKIKAPNLGLSYVDDNRVDELMSEQKQYKWILAFSKDNKHELSANTTYDKTVVNTLIDDMSCFQEVNIQKPQDAFVKESENGFVIEPEVAGNELIRDKVHTEIIAAIDAGKTEISLDDLGCYESPAVLSDNSELVKEVEALNQMTAAVITYDFGDDRTEVVDRSLIQDWLDKDESGEYVLDTDKVSEFVRSMAYQYDTFGLKREVVTHSGSKVTLTGGDYGWCINKTKTTEALIEAINNGVVETMDPVFLYSAKNKGIDDIGGTYVEISIQDQKMWLYENGQQVLETAVVTGNVAKGYDTPAGSCWAIDAKKQDAILTGEGYSSPVTFWLPFNGNVGIHDADRWRSSYGEDIYLTKGSHGCVNTPYNNAEKIFNTVEIGTPVIVY